jgi:hypothetical protein
MSERRVHEGARSWQAEPIVTAGGEGVPPAQDRTREVPPPGQGPVVLAALAIGVLFMAIQLWLLTVALDMFLAGSGSRVWQLALASGAIFAGGLLILRVLRQRPRVGR